MGKIKAAREYFRNNGRKLDELLWSEIYHDSIIGVEWIKNEPFSLSPGRWAVGYNWLYIATRVLTDFKPSKVLEFGLGQSSVMINQYFRNNEIWPQGGVKKHIIIEQDKQWGGIFTRTHSLSNAFSLSICELDRSAENSFYHRGQLSRAISEAKFEFISVDGPNDGGMIMNGSARSDILDYLPDILERDFCIVFDDYNNPRKISTGMQVEKKLRESGIMFRTAVYRGQTDVKVIVSESLKYMTTL